MIVQPGSGDIDADIIGFVIVNDSESYLPDQLNQDVHERYHWPVREACEPGNRYWELIPALSTKPETRW